MLAPSVLGALLLPVREFVVRLRHGGSADQRQASPSRRSRSARFLNGNVIPGQENVGKALGFGIVVIVAVVMIAAMRSSSGGRRDGCGSDRVFGRGRETKRGAGAGAPPLASRAAGPHSVVARDRADHRGRVLRRSFVHGAPVRARDHRRTAWTFEWFQLPIPHSEMGFSFRLRAVAPPGSLVTTVITLVLMVPTTVYVHLRLPRLRRLLEGITILPIVIPPIVLIVGGAAGGPPRSRVAVPPGPEYVVLAMPFAYRALDAGLRAIDLKTFIEAAGSLGAGWSPRCGGSCCPTCRTASCGDDPHRRAGPR